MLRACLKSRWRRLEIRSEFRLQAVSGRFRLKAGLQTGVFKQALSGVSDRGSDVRVWCYKGIFFAFHNFRRLCVIAPSQAREPPRSFVAPMRPLRFGQSCRTSSGMGACAGEVHRLRYHKEFLFAVCRPATTQPPTPITHLSSFKKRLKDGISCNPRPQEFRPRPSATMLIVARRAPLSRQARLSGFLYLVPERARSARNHSAVPFCTFKHVPTSSRHRVTRPEGASRTPKE